MKKKVTYFNGAWIEYTFDKNDNCIKKATHDGYWVEYTFDLNGNCIFIIDSNGFWVKRKFNKYNSCKYEKNKIGSRIWYKVPEKRKYDDYREIMFFVRQRWWSENKDVLGQYRAYHKRFVRPCIDWEHTDSKNTYHSSTTYYYNLHSFATKRPCMSPE